MLFRSRVIKPCSTATVVGRNTKGELDNNTPRVQPDWVFSLAKCPYGQVGSILWVRETHYRYGKWIKNGITKTGRQKWAIKPVENGFNVRYFENPPSYICKKKDEIGYFKRPAIFMPRKYARLFPEITEIRVQRVQEISEVDAVAEGANPGYILASPTIFHKRLPNYTETPKDFRLGYQRLWDSINGKKYPWASNPWVWIIEFKKV